MSSSPLQTEELRRKSLHGGETYGGNLYPKLDELVAGDVDSEDSKDEEDDPTSAPSSNRCRKRNQSPSRQATERRKLDDSPNSPDPDIHYRRQGKASPPDPLPPSPPRRPAEPSYDHSTSGLFDVEYSQQLLVLIGLVIAAVIVIWFLYFFCHATSGRNSKRLSMMDIYIKESNRLRSDLYHNQHGRFWTTLRSSVKSVFQRFDPSGQLSADRLVGERSPAVLLFISDANDVQARSTASCIIKKLANITAVAFASERQFSVDYLDLDGYDFSDNENGDAKYALEKKLHGHFNGKKTSPVVILRNVHALSSEAALILHAYCDNENAPFRESVYYLSADCDLHGETAEGSWDELAETCLREKWLTNEGLSIDKVAPILSRIANNVVYVFPESTGGC